MTLNDRLRRIREAGAAKRDPAINRAMHQATADLRESGILDGVPAPGDAAPVFSRPDLAGNEVTLTGLLDQGPVILSFFRGRW